MTPSRPFPTRLMRLTALLLLGLTAVALPAQTPQEKSKAKQKSAEPTAGQGSRAAMAALADVACPVRVVGLVPAAENAVSGNSLRPGDVIRHYGGRTSEVTNTDAEGRLVMADALAYAVAEIEPDVIVDVATLTGAMKVALGQHTGGYFANDDALAT
eukprot:gene5885-7309_t